MEKAFQILEHECNLLLLNRRVLEGGYSVIVSLTVLLRFGFVKNVFEYVPESVSSTKTICFQTIPLSVNLSCGLPSPFKLVPTHTGLFKEK